MRGTYVLIRQRLESCGSFLRRVLYPEGPLSGGSFRRTPMKLAKRRNRGDLIEAFKASNSHSQFGN